MPRSNTTGPRVRLSVSLLEDRLTPASVGVVAVDESEWYAVGSLPGETGTATVYDADGTVAFTVTPYGDGFTGGVRVALADVTGDGTADLVTAPGKGIDATVKVYDGATQAEVASFLAYEPGFTGGAYVAAADVTGDGSAEVVTGADEGGGPRVKVFDGSTISGTTAPTALSDFLAIDDANFRGGVRLSLGDVGGDGVPDLLVGAGFGGGPRVVAYDGAALADGQQVELIPDFFAYEPGLRNGVFPSVGDLNGDGRGDLVFGAGPGGGPRVLALDGRAARDGSQTVLSDFFAGDESSREGVQVGTVGTSDGRVELMGVDLATGAVGFYGPDGSPRPGRGGPRGGFAAGMPFAGPGATVGDADALTEAVVGTYTGSGTGSLAALTGTGGLDAETAAATITLEITDATPVGLPDGADDDTPLVALTLTGTVTITVDGQDPLTLPFTGILLLARGGPDSTDSEEVHGRLTVSTNRTDGTTGPGTGFSLSGTLDGGNLTVGRLVASDRTGTDGGYVFQSPEARDSDRIVLTNA